MKMKRTIEGAALAAVLATLTACDYVQRREMKDERADRHYQAAMTDYTAGRLDAAAAGFEKAIRSDPGNASARFQYACLLQDAKHDWLGAICHYREFLLQAPGSDKAKMAKDRLAICEQMYANQLTRPADGAAAPAADPAADRKSAKLAGDLKAAEARLAALTEENARLRRMLGAVGADGGRRAPAVRTDVGPDADGGAARTVRADDVRSLLDDDEGDRLKLSPDARALFGDEEAAGGGSVPADVRALVDGEEAADASRTVPDDVLALGLEDDDGPRVAVPQGRAVTLRQQPERPAPKAEEPLHEERPATYVVEEGDTLYKLALRFYGRRSAWQKIRDANKATVTTDGRIQAGQTLVLP